MVWKKVTNSDAGDSNHFGGDDVDKISLTFNAETQTDPINIKDENLYIVDPADTAKKVRFDAGGITSSNTRVITIPDANITLASTVAASSSVAGLMSAADKTKLDAVEASADVTDSTNVNAAGALMLTDTTTAGLGIVIDEDAMGSNLDTKVPTQQSVVAYVASQITAEDLDATTDSGTIDIDLNSETLTVAGGEGIDTSATGTTITVTAEDASATNKGVVELATTAELNTGTDTTRAVTVAGIEASARSVKLDAIEASADVTDITNVNAAAATVVGTIATGTWEGTAIAVNKGGTGATASTGTGSTVRSISPALTGTATGVNLTLSGDLTVSGTSTTVNVEDLTVDTADITIMNGNTTASLADDSGIKTQIGSSSFKTLLWKHATSAWTSSDNIDSTEYKIAGTTVLSGSTLGSTITGSSLTSVGTLGTLSVDNLTIDANKIEATNTNGDVELDSNGTGVVKVLGNTNDGAITLNCTDNSHGQTVKSQPHSAAVTNTMLLPAGASSTLVSLVSTDTLTNKTLTSPTLTTPALGTPSAGILSGCTALPAAQVTQGTMASGMVLVAPVLGTPASGDLQNCTALPAAQVTQGTMQSGMVMVAPVLGTPASGDLQNCTALPAAQVTAGTMATGHTIPDATLTFSIRLDQTTAYVPVLADSGKVVTLDNGSATTCIIPLNSSVAFPVGCSLTWIQIGAGQVTISGVSGVTVTSSGGTAASPAITAQHNSATAIKTATNTWRVIGAIE